MFDCLILECDATVKFRTTDMRGEDTRKCLLNMRVETSIADGSILLFTFVMRNWSKVVRELFIETDLTSASLFLRLDSYTEREDEL